MFYKHKLFKNNSNLTFSERKFKKKIFDNSLEHNNKKIISHSNSNSHSHKHKFKNINEGKENTLLQDYSKLKHRIFLREKREKDLINEELLEDRRRDINFSNMKKILQKLFQLKTQDGSNPFNYNLKQRQLSLDALSKNLKRNRVNEILKRIVLHFSKIDSKIDNNPENSFMNISGINLALKLNREQSAKFAEKNIKDIINEINNKKKIFMSRNFKFKKKYYISSGFNCQTKVNKEQILNSNESEKKEKSTKSNELNESYSNPLLILRDNYRRETKLELGKKYRSKRPFSCNINYFKNKKLLFQNKSFLNRKCLIKVKNLPIYTTKIGDLVKDYFRIKKNSKKLMIRYKENHFSTYAEIEKIIQAKEDMLMTSLKNKYFQTKFPKNKDGNSRTKLDYVNKLKSYIEYIEDIPGRIEKLNDELKNST